MELRQLIDPKKDEEIVFSLRRHPIVFAGDIAMIAVVSFVPVVSFFFLLKLWPNMLSGTASRPALILIAGAYYLMVWLFFIATFVDYYLDIWIVTTYRIVNVEQHSLFHRTISELDLAKIQDVTSEVKGIVPSILDFGDIFIQTAGEKERFIFEQIHHAHDIRKKLLDLVDTERTKQLSPITDHLE